MTKNPDPIERCAAQIGEYYDADQTPDEIVIAVLKELGEILRYSGRIYAATDIETIIKEHEQRETDDRAD